MNQIIISQIINAPLELVFEYYLNPADNLRWNTAGEGCTTSYARIDHRVGGEFHIGFQGPTLGERFDLGCVYNEIVIS
jgi:uncharacterized protein YndB with AHSA1/START domain